ncbi:hypothetical protein [Halalkalibacter lacteus]|uniref:hypothetical protein n=1 Tax=Halalkalibacter lacteus TaxID=3090663 RepID=UPI002FCBAC31
MPLLKNQHLMGISWILVILLLVASFLIISKGYFNTKEISSLTSQCYENGGEIILEIHDNLTNEYSFECK